MGKAGWFLFLKGSEMQVTVEDVSSVKKVLHIEIPENRVVKELDSAYATLKKTAKVKGFRPGKTPRSVLERLYRKDVAADVTSRLIQESFADALKETALDIVGSPSIDPPPLEGKGPYAFAATVEVRPRIGDIDFKGLELKKNLYQVGDEQVEAQLKMLQKGVATLRPVDPPRPAQDGDAVLIDYEGFVDGNPLAETQRTENYTMHIGRGQISPELDAGIVGMSAGDSKDIEVTFPPDHFNRKLAGKKVTFAVTLKDVREEILPEIDDAFAKQVSKFESLEALREDIRRHLQSGYDKRAEQEINEQCFTALIEKTDFEVPEVMVAHELEGILTDAERSFSYRNTSLEEMGYTREGLADRYRPVAEKQVRRHLILSRLIEQEGLTLSGEELDAGIRGISESYGQPFEELKKYYESDKNQLEYLKHTLLEKKALTLIIDSSRIEEVVPGAREAEGPEGGETAARE
jgi:trigger factor